MRFLLLTLATLLLLAAGCEGDTAAEEGQDETASYPEWIESVYPAPGSELSVTRMVQVNHNVVTSERAVRLTINGVDLTTYADENTPSLLVYDPDSLGGEPPVELGSGEHSATVELLNVEPATDAGGLGYEVLDVEDTFSWTFTIL